MTDISSKALGEYIRKTREERGISRAELAQRIHVSYEALSKYEAGKRVPDFGMIGRIAEELQISVQDIYDNSKGEMSNKVATIVITSILIVVVIGGCILGLLHNGKVREKPDSHQVGTEEETIENETTTENITNDTPEKLLYMAEPCSDWTYSKECYQDGDYYLIKSEVLDIMLVECGIEGDKLVATLYYQSKTDDCEGWPLGGIKPTFVGLYVDDEIISEDLVDFIDICDNCSGTYRLTWDIKQRDIEKIMDKELYIDFYLLGNYSDDFSGGPLPEPLIYEERLKISTEDDENDCAGYFKGTKIPYYTGVIDEEDLYCIIKSEIFDVQVIDVSEDRDNLIWYLRGVNRSNQNPSSSFVPAERMFFQAYGAYIDGVEIPDSAVGSDLDGAEIYMDNPKMFHVTVKKSAIPSYKDSIDDVGKVEMKIAIIDDPRGQVRDATLFLGALEFPHEVEH